MLDLMEEDNFLHSNICKYCIDYIKTNMTKTKIYNKRHVLPINETSDPTLINVVNHYKNLYLNHYLNNIQIVYWPVGEKHIWHRDDLHYDKTTITYLNDNYEDGRTIVKDKIIQPKIGKIIKFDGNILHAVTQLTKGKRYVIVAWYNKNG
jgi:predicted 2-oxoglutarate/Fe(II)-dependent dioxygenase YbiX